MITVEEAILGKPSAGSAAHLLDHVLVHRQPLPAEGHGLLAHETDFYNFYIRRAGHGLDHAASQFGQDMWVAFLLDCWDLDSRAARAGYFVEFGAFDGLTNSNTLLFERQFGWRGILAEPLKSAVAQCARNRHVIIDPRCVWQASNEVLEFNIVPGAEQLATLKSFEAGDFHAERRRESQQSMQVRTVSLNDLLMEHRAPAIIDYMSVDTEGSELAILQAFDFDRWQINVMSVEHNWTPQRQAIRNLLAEHGLFHLERSVDYCDDLFVRRRAR